MRLVLIILALGCRGRPAPLPATQVAVGSAPVDPRTPTVRSGGVDLFVRVAGDDDDPALVLVHGGPGMSHEATLAFERLTTLGVRVVNYDQRGCGRSGQPADGAFTPADYVADIEAIRTAIGADRIRLLGHSWGAVPVMAYGEAHPDHVAGVAFVSGMPPTLAGFRDGMARFGAHTDELVAAGVIPTLEEVLASIEDGSGPGISAWLPAYFADPTDSRIASIHGAWNAETNRRTFEALGAFDYRPALARVEVPSLVVMGTADAFGVEWARATARALPRSRVTLVEIEGSGHFPWIDDGAEPFWSAVVRWLDATRGPSSP